MKVKDFIAQSISEIMDGVIEAQEHAATREGTLVNPSVGHSRYPDNFIVTVHEGLVPLIEFDISITTDDEGTIEVGGGIISGFWNIGGRAKARSKDSSLSRIKFAIPVALPKQGRIDTSSQS